MNTRKKITLIYFCLTAVFCGGIYAFLGLRLAMITLIVCLPLYLISIMPLKTLAQNFVRLLFFCCLWGSYLYFSLKNGNKISLNEVLVFMASYIFSTAALLIGKIRTGR